MVRTSGCRWRVTHACRGGHGHRARAAIRAAAPLKSPAFSRDRAHLDNCARGADQLQAAQSATTRRRSTILFDRFERWQTARAILQLATFVAVSGRWQRPSAAMTRALAMAALVLVLACVAVALLGRAHQMDARSALVRQRLPRLLQARTTRLGATLHHPRSGRTRRRTGGAATWSRARPGLRQWYGQHLSGPARLDVTGIDMVPEALAMARRRAAAARVSVDFVQGDVTRLHELGVRGPFTLVLDFGCLHTLPVRPAQRLRRQRVGRGGAGGDLSALRLCSPAEIRADAGRD